MAARPDGLAEADVWPWARSREPVMLGVMTQYDVHAQPLPEQITAVVTATLRVPEIGPWLAKAYGAVAGVLSAQGAGPCGPPFARFSRLAGDQFAIEAGFPATTAITGTDGVTPSVLPGGPAASVMYVGPYDQMEPAYEALSGWIREHGGEPAGDAWEIYFSDPASEPDPAGWRTQIVQPYLPRDAAPGK